MEMEFLTINHEYNNALLYNVHGIWKKEEREAANNCHSVELVGTNFAAEFTYNQ